MCILPKLGFCVSLKFASLAMQTKHNIKANRFSRISCHVKRCWRMAHGATPTEGSTLTFATKWKETASWVSKQATY